MTGETVRHEMNGRSIPHQLDGNERKRVELEGRLRKG